MLEATLVRPESDCHSTWQKQIGRNRGQRFQRGPRPFAAFAAWIPTYWPFHIDKERLRLWKRTIGLLQEPKIWQAVETTVCRLLDREILNNDDLRELSNESGE